MKYIGGDSAEVEIGETGGRGDRFCLIGSQKRRFLDRLGMTTA